MKKLLLLRHGESTWNKENRFTGWTDVPLSEKGIKEAGEAGRLLAKEGFIFFASQALGFRHSHLDGGDYSYDQKEKSKDPAKAVDFLVKDEQGRMLLTSMVA